MARGLKTKTLRRMLKKKGMKTTGKKATLMKRLHLRGGGQMEDDTLASAQSAFDALGADATPEAKKAAQDALDAAKNAKDEADKAATSATEAAVAATPPTAGRRRTRKEGGRRRRKSRRGEMLGF